MRALRCNHYGSIGDLVVEEVPDPVPAAGEVVVDVAAAGVNFPDALIVADRYQVHVAVPFTPGSEYAGTVSAVGADVRGLAVGDRVAGVRQVGAFAEKTVTPESSVRVLGPEVEFVAAAAFANTYRTAYLGLRALADLQAGEWLVVLGAAGGVGLATVELGTMLGARVVAVASTKAKRAATVERGATATIDPTTEDVKERIRELTGGADVVVDPVGGPLAEQALRATRFGGRFVTVGFASGEIPRIPLNLVLLKGTIITGFTIDGLTRARPDDVARLDGELWELFESGAVRPHVGAVFPLDDAAAAIAEVAERRAVGKVVIQMRPVAGGRMSA